MDYIFVHECPQSQADLHDGIGSLLKAPFLADIIQIDSSILEEDKKVVLAALVHTGPVFASQKIGSKKGAFETLENF